MNVSPQLPFTIVYSLLQHEFLGVLFQSSVVQLDANNRLMLTYQHISQGNVKDFAHRLDKRDLLLVRLMDELRMEHIVRQFSTKKISPQEFFLKYFKGEKGAFNGVQNTVIEHVEKRKSQIITLLDNRLIFETSNDGNPTHKRLYLEKEPASVLFHFFKNSDNTHYFPTIKHQGQKLDFRGRRDAVVVCNEPACLLLDERLYLFKQAINGKKLQPFIQKKFMSIPQRVEKEYYKKFVAPLIAEFEVHAEGFKIQDEFGNLSAKLYFSEVGSARLFESSEVSQRSLEEPNDVILYIRLDFFYGQRQVRTITELSAQVFVEEEAERISFVKVRRRLDEEHSLLAWLLERGLDFKKGYTECERGNFFGWLSQNADFLAAQNIELLQEPNAQKRYFVGKSSFTMSIEEGMDWFDIAGKVLFGPYLIPFIKIRQYILKGQQEFKLPNGEMAVIPTEWFSKYADFLELAQLDPNNENGAYLPKFHFALAQKLHDDSHIKVLLSRNLQQLLNFESLESAPIPAAFKGTLRPYQKAGYDWLCFLQKFHFGGCLADDMGLGKTVQTLALLAGRLPSQRASLLVVPNSLLYNWQIEIKRFAPDMRVYMHKGTERSTSTLPFQMTDLVITSYGTLRSDAQMMMQFHFDYIVLDEAQAIKNPLSQLTKTVFELKSNHKLVLTGTPIENSASDLWSLMNFTNRGLLGTFSYFKTSFLQPIEKKNSQDQLDKLRAIVKPFMMRRLKTQVATDLPEKVEQICYVEMSEEQKKVYETTKSVFRNNILERIENFGLAQSQIFILQGINALRQVANHPQMLDENYTFDSGKLNAIMENLDNALKNGHKVLVFSSYVRHLQIVRKELDALQISYSYLDGQTQDRKSQIDAFQEDGQRRVFLLSLKAGGVGLNLTAADYVFLLDPWWNPAAEMQATDRAHRIGQVKSVFIYKFISQESIEEKIVEMQKAKLRLSDELILSEDGFMKQLDRADIEKLFE